MPFFTPPVRDGRGWGLRGHHSFKLFNHYGSVPVGYCVWRSADLLYHESEYPYDGGQTFTVHDGDTTTTFVGPPGLKEATEVYLGGRTHVITAQQAADLSAAGYGSYIT